MTTDSERLKKQQEQIDLLMKMVPKASLARHMPKSQIGMDIKVTMYDGKLVTSWKLLTNKVRVEKTGEVADQQVLITFDGDAKSLNFLEAKLKQLKDPDKIKEAEKQIEDAKSGCNAEMNLIDFGMLEKVSVTVDTEKTAYERDGSAKEFFFTLDGVEKSILSLYVN